MDLSSKHSQVTSVVAGVQTADLIIRNDQKDGDIKIYGNDNGVDTLLLTFDSSVPSIKPAVDMAFQDDISLLDGKKLVLGTGSDGELYSSSDNVYIKNVTSDKDIIFNINDGGVAKDILTLDASANTLVLSDASSSLASGVISGTQLLAMQILPKASVATASIDAHRLFVLGDNTGNTAFGFGDVTKESRGLMACFGRTAIATSAWTNTDVAMDVRMINKLANDAAYNMRGGYVKCKNYSGGTVGTLNGFWVEAVADGTDTTATGLRISADNSTIDTALVIDSMTATNLIDASTAMTVTNVFKFTDGQGAVVGSMSAKNPENDSEAGYLKIVVGSTSYQIPFYAVS